MSHQCDFFEYSLKSNDVWQNFKNHQNPAFFKRSEAGQAPKILWLGCSDSRVPETTILGLQPGDVFVHRNIANIIYPTDINCMAVIEYAVDHLKVESIVLCGHSRCGGAAAALDDSRVGGVIDAWITPLRMIRRQKQALLNCLPNDKVRAVKLAELGVEIGISNIMSIYCVEEAIRTRGLSVHGVMYDVASGKIQDLGLGSKNYKSLSIATEEPVRVVKGSHGMLVFSGDGAKTAVR